ncbi:hypothetical protein E9529_19975 [Blastococcus sp. KM273128]|uniref:hypothetical protein n=1 Tax=Blastococcus sp. KM273128 TaxID=2570314 RepID=UPI001F2E3EA0|nr:hypothetical protein [Blastococcus sp. KM273128]MCF6746510.1 hypothetical protein [Blastococcus sp. KM273128]
MTHLAARPRSVAVAVWAVLVTATAVVAALPGDPGTVPAGWLVALALLGVLAFRGSDAAYAVLVVLNAVLLSTALLLATPVAAPFWAFYGLVAAALAALVGIPLLARRTAVAASAP